MPAPTHIGPGPGGDGRRVDPAVAHEVAAAYLDAPARRDPLVVEAYARLVSESDRLFHEMTDPGRPEALRVRFTRCPEPYRDADELIVAVREARLLEVTTVAGDPDRRHPLMDGSRGGAYDRFRAVHDAIGHGRRRLGFDRHGEFGAWLAQEPLHGPLARRALATELHGQHSVRWTTGQVAEPKAVLLDPGLIFRSRAGARADHGDEPCPWSGGGRAAGRAERTYTPAA